MKHTPVVQIREGQSERDGADNGRDEDDGDGYFGSSHAALDTGTVAQAEIKNTGPDEIELLLDTERPKMLERPHGGGCVIMKEEESAEYVDLSNSKTSGPAEQKKHGDIEIDGRQDAHGASKVEAAHADGSALLLFMQEKTGNQIAANNEEDEYARISIEYCKPEERDVVADTESLKGMESDDEKNRQGPQTIEAGDTRHGCGSCGQGLRHVERALYRVII